MKTRTRGISVSCWTSWWHWSRLKSAVQRFRDRPAMCSSEHPLKRSRQDETVKMMVLTDCKRTIQLNLEPKLAAVEEKLTADAKSGNQTALEAHNFAHSKLQLFQFEAVATSGIPVQPVPQWERNSLHDPSMIAWACKAQVCTGTTRRHDLRTVCHKRCATKGPRLAQLVPA
eukprot:5386628-Amphidinium_carterae.1